MITHYFKIAFRNLWKYKTQSFIGIFGLAFGIACFVPALYWLRYETTYDGFYPDAAHIYRIYAIEKQSGKVNEMVPGILEAKLHDYFPATETSAGLDIRYENYRTEETPHIRLRTLQTDSAFFRIFPQTFVSGDALQPLQTMRNIVLTETTAIRLFGDVEKAIGQQFSNTVYRLLPYTVTAVVKDPPPHTNLPFDAIQFPEMGNEFISYMPVQAQWTYFNKQMYVKLHPRADIDELAELLRDFTTRLETNANIELQMLPIGDVRHRLNTDLPFTLGFIRLFVAAGALLLFSAFFNFLNLHLDLFRQRIQEMRQRAVVGAKSWQLILQMMFELTCIIFLALALACCFVVIIQPMFSGLLDITMKMSQLFNTFIVCGIFVIALILVVGIIPFWRLSRLAIRNISKWKRTGQFALRRMAVTVQLAVSVVFIIAALVVMMQMRFVNRKDLGFDRSGVIQLSGLNMGNRNHRTALMHELTAMPQIENISATDFEPQHDDHTLIIDVEWAGKSPNERPVFQNIYSDNHFAETFRLKMMQGKWWNEGERQKVVLNEEAVRVMGLSEPIGAIVSMNPGYILETGNPPMQEYEVVGVVNDFHTLSLRSRIYPAIFREPMFSNNNLYIRVIHGQEREAIRRISAILPDINATMIDVRLTPLDELYNRLNHSEQAGLKMFAVLATVCLFISLFGIYAIAVASTQRRRKEIAIRKVFGAGVRDIVRMFFREYTALSALAGAIALPLAYLAMNRWLQGYAYRTNIPLWLLIVVVITVTAVILLTVLKQVLKAANSNPAEVIKSE